MSKRPRILIADDEEGIRESLSLILEDDYDLVFAANGQETLEALKKDAIALILLDIKMPKLDGIEVLKRIREKGITTPVVMLSAYQSVDLAKEALKLGACNYLPKPFERIRILDAVRDAIQD